jgi:hypothetical protein
MFNPYPCQVHLYQKGFSFGKFFGRTFLIEVLVDFLQRLAILVWKLGSVMTWPLVIR